MPYLATGVIALGILFMLAQAFTSADPRSLVKTIRYAIGGVFVAFGLLLVFAERWTFGLCSSQPVYRRSAPGASARSILAAASGQLARYRRSARSGSKCGSITTAER